MEPTTTAPVKPVATLGDGAVGLCGVLAARRLGAERIIAMGHHEDRLEIAESFGATDLVSARGEAAVEEAAFLDTAFGDNIALRGGVAPVRAYIEELIADVLQGTLDPSPVFTKTVDLDGVPEGYRAMDEREAVKVLVEI
jgi:alcohol dehydrogenase